MDPPDDWVNGSWTVDCICGVNFDDGEEMVNCDECGVWVHTRCSRYVKGDEIFVCDKCKCKNDKNDSEETEVAQLLVELPTKTLNMESTYVCNGSSQRPFRLWTDKPIEDKVHVHGIPGGDPAIFRGLSSVFTPQLWKCTGYVPKKFSFQYREFPCWDEDQSDVRNSEKNENPVDKGAGVLFSLSKNNASAAPVAALIGMRSKVEDSLRDRKVFLNEKQGLSEDVNRCAENGARERSFLRPIILNSAKCKKEDLLSSKDQTGKKKSTSSDKVTNIKKRLAHSSKIVFTSVSDEKQLAFYQDRDLKYFKADSENPRNKDSENPRNKNSREVVVRESTYDAYNVVKKKPDHSKYNFELSPGIFSSEVSKNNSFSDAEKKEHNEVQVAPAIENSTNFEGDSLPQFDKTDVKGDVMKQGGRTALDNSDYGTAGFSKSVLKPYVEVVASTGLEIKDDQIHQDVNRGFAIDSVQTDVKLKIDQQHDDSEGALKFQSSHADPTELQTCNDPVSENLMVNSTPESGGRKAQDVNRNSEVAGDRYIEKADELCSNPCQLKQELNWPEVSLEKHISSPQISSEFSEKQSKPGGLVVHSHAPSQHKTVVGVGKSSPASSNAIISKAYVSNDLTPVDAEIRAKHEVISGSFSRKERSSYDVVRDVDKGTFVRKKVKEHPKEYINSTTNSSCSGGDLQDPISKRTTVELKDSMVLSTVTKASAEYNIPDSSGCSECNESHPSHKGLAAPSKTLGSCLPQRCDKPSQTNFNPSSKVSQRHGTTIPASTNPPSVLSDEELAFLLHQELNSSPRVPRVPRLRQTGCSPQLGSPNATSMLIKRTSSSRGRDHVPVSRMKNKDGFRDAFHGSHEPDDEVKRTDEALSSPDQRRPETSYSANATSKREESGSPTRLNALKKSALSAYATNTASSGPSSSMEANDHNNSSIRNSPRNTSDDETGTIGEGPVHHTLPGLIDEIMSKGRRMTYEELCNAVLPHWHNLRKHNGERYAYTSHSQAVLDCLRNRREWARLVDRGPKTNTSRKKRKFDAEESEDSEYSKGRTTKAVECKSLESPREEFPKRKRNSRKRRLALQGRGIRDIRKRRKTDMFTDDDDVELLSDSSEGSMFSGDELQEGDECSQRREGSDRDE